MALRMFTVIAESGSNDRAFEIAQQNPLLAGRTRYELLDPTTVYPSDKLAHSRAEHLFGVQPDATQVSIAGEKTNTVWAVRILADPGAHRLMFFGLRRV